MLPSFHIARDTIDVKLSAAFCQQIKSIASIQDVETGVQEMPEQKTVSNWFQYRCEYSATDFLAFLNQYSGRKWRMATVAEFVRANLGNDSTKQGITRYYTNYSRESYKHGIPSPFINKFGVKVTNSPEYLDFGGPICSQSLSNLGIGMDKSEIIAEPPQHGVITVHEWSMRLVEEL